MRSRTWASAAPALTFFAEDTRDALYSQTTLDAAANRNISRVQNIGRIATTGLELAMNSQDWLLRGLDLSASVTYADSTIKENAGFVVTPGDTIGKWQPNIPRWRATALASYRFDDHWTSTLGARYSGTQYRTLNNADVNGYTYQGRQQVRRRRPAPALEDRSAMERRVRHRQPEQLRLLELPSVPAAQLFG